MKCSLSCAVICLLSCLLLPGCNKDEFTVGSGTASPDGSTASGVHMINAGTYTAHPFFTEQWGSADASSELTAMAYDAADDMFFWIKGRPSANNELMRYNFSNGRIEDVYSFTSQYDYGLRVFGNEMWIVRTYDTSLVRLTSLAGAAPVVQASYMPRGSQPAFHDVNDVAMVNGDLYFITGNFLVQPKYEGLQCLRGPDYSAIEHVTPEIWPSSNYSNERYIVSVGTGSESRFVIAMGVAASDRVTTPLALELRDASGNLIRTQEGYGNSYLEKDSKNRIYTVQTYHSPLRILRWSAELERCEMFSVHTSTKLENCFARLFVVRERKADSVDVIMTEYRTQSSPTFEMVTLPK